MSPAEGWAAGERDQWERVLNRGGGAAANQIAASCRDVEAAPPGRPMTLTRGSFTYSNGEEYHGEWKEGKTDSTDPPPPPPSLHSSPSIMGSICMHSTTVVIM
ncbi:hypothetical protein INR49_018505 [Caranx melampygus]|nr:hypothetical protein INR49_018505 [Caranx melampygus]